MIPVAEAKKRIQENTELLDPITVQLYEATGLILANDIYSNIDVPSFNQSAMDGYGLRFDDLQENKALILDGEIPAGVFPTNQLLPNNAVRIFTGAPIPEGCDTVVMQEKVTVEQNKLFVNDSQISKGLNIRLKGSQTKKGELTLKSGNKITAGAAGYLAMLGIDKINVFRTPRISIINTGKELSKPGLPLDAGKVYECNSYSLNAALAELNIKPKTMDTVDDDLTEISKLIKNNLHECDVLILSGGVSVGDYDFVYEACNNCSVEMIFHKIKQKPGKPLYFGKYKNTLVFGLPGNPSALLTCYYEYIAPSLKKMMGMATENETKIYRCITESYKKKEGLTYFLKGKISGNNVIPLPAQESYLISSFAHADCIIQLDENVGEVKKGELVEVHFLNQTL